MLGECDFELGNQCYLLLSSVEAIMVTTYAYITFIQDDCSTLVLGIIQDSQSLLFTWKSSACKMLSNACFLLGLL